ncbi:hypothetical protein ZIOFF_005506 [Zingiber officinale]|uniref:hAT-like transposase RNase-H fold domain-containing protein n=1 Tax=Zingiber officinale TaxID=94328 RepID=A0A8J5LRQ4_ZINOF|nr:hypothetical protein ZIOFF_005506 [Zingiber officinale]
MGGVQASTNDINEASQSKDVTDNNEDEENKPYCRKKRKCTSPVWTDFKQITLPDGKMKAKYIHLLDPRNKMKLIEWCFLEIYSEVDAIEHIVTVCETLCLLYSEYVKAHGIDIAKKDVQGQKEISSDSFKYP